jgi:hypothetical protein
VRIGRRYSVENIAPVEVAPGSRVVWVFTTEQRTWEFIEPGALVTCVSYDAPPDEYVFTMTPPGDTGGLTLIVNAEQPVDVRFDDGRWPVRTWRWCWYYLSASVAAIWSGALWAAGKVVKFFMRLARAGRQRW